VEAREARLGELCHAYAKALLVGDEIAAEATVREALDVGIGSAEIDDEIIAPALWLVGELWERGEISIAEEHLATEISLRVMALEREARRVAHARPGGRVMLATPGGEQHVVALRMIENLLRDAGYGVLMLGSDVPASALAAAALRHRPHVICMSSTMPGGRDRVLVAVHAVQQELPGVSFVVGGRGLGSRLRARPGISVCTRVSEIVEAVDAQIQRAELN
jgi:MerR family transcriptional regulator, light-induced transcriptional regulator